jgi:hypothetical protein
MQHHILKFFHRLDRRIQDFQKRYTERREKKFRKEIYKRSLQKKFNEI